MTTEERFERIEHLTAGLAEERRKDREEYRTLWRDTQRQLNELGTRVVQLSEADSRLEARIEQLAEESRAADQRLEERIGSLVSAVGQFITKGQ
jgi:chromosome segregation ATPase